METNVLLVGWFSTVGDIEVLEFARQTLARMNVRFAVCSVIDPISTALQVPLLAALEPGDFTHVLWVCGPVWAGMPEWHALAKFSHCVFGGINLTLIGFDSLETTPFDYVHARDWNGAGRHVDLSFHAPMRKVPVIGVILAPEQHEYGERQRHGTIAHAITQLKDGVDWAFLHMDTRWPARDVKAVSLRSAQEFESVLSRLDLVITSRLHGLVLARKNGVPVVAVDPVSGGDKVSSQARLLGTPCLSAEDGALARRIRSIIEETLDCPASAAGDEAIGAEAAAGLIAGLEGLLRMDEGRARAFFARLRIPLWTRLGRWLQARRYRLKLCRAGLIVAARRVLGS